MLLTHATALLHCNLCGYATFVLSETQCIFVFTSNLVIALRETGPLTKSLPLPCSCKHVFSIRVGNSEDSDQNALWEATRSGSAVTVFLRKD